MPRTRSKRRKFWNADPTCWYCGRYLSFRNATIDHFIPKELGGLDDESNLRLACRTCNETKGVIHPNYLVCAIRPPLSSERRLLRIWELQNEETTMSRKSAFDYGSLDEKHRTPTQAHALKIHDIISNTAEGIVEIGKRLQTVKKTIGIRLFNEWLKEEFLWSQATASNYMRTADKFGNLDCIRNFQPSALTQFVRERVPAKAINEAVELARSGELITKKKAIEIVARHGVKSSDNKPHQVPKPDAWHHLRSSIRTLFNQVDQLTNGIDRDEIDALADELLQLALQLRSATRKATQKPPKTKPKPKRRTAKSAA